MPCDPRVVGHLDPEAVPKEKEVVMTNKDQFKGKAKQAIGDLLGDKDLHKEGKADEKAGDVKGFVEKVKDKADDVVDKVKEKVSKD